MPPTKEIQPLRLAGRCADGAERDSGRLHHAVPYYQLSALCGARPGRLSAGWGSEAGESVTCLRCIRKIREAMKEIIS